MPDHLAALQHMLTSDFALGLQSAALEWCEPCDARRSVAELSRVLGHLRNARALGEICRW
jgi:hypothetical protein